MKVRVELAGGFKASMERELEVELPDSASLGALVELLKSRGYLEPALLEEGECVVAVVEGHLVPPDRWEGTLLGEGMAISFYPPLSGG